MSKESTITRSVEEKQLRVMWAAVKCTGCSKNLLSEIYECSDHLLCYSCRRNFRYCPKCNVALDAIEGAKRNAGLEKLVLKLPIECPNIKFGCSEICTGSDLKRHIKQCDFTHYRCPYDDDPMCEKNARFNKTNMESHILERHSMHVKAGNVCSEGKSWEIQMADWDINPVCFHIKDWGMFFLYVSIQQGITKQQRTCIATSVHFGGSPRTAMPVTEPDTKEVHMYYLGLENEAKKYTFNNSSGEQDEVASLDSMEPTHRARKLDAGYELKNAKVYTIQIKLQKEL